MKYTTHVALVIRRNINMGYLYSNEKMIHLIKEGTAAKKNGQSVIFNRKLEVTSNNVKCYLIIEGETEEKVKNVYENTELKVTIC